MTPDDPLRRELRELPRFTAHAGFRERLLRRLDSPDQAAPPRWRWAPVVATLGALVAVAALLVAQFGPWGDGPRGVTAASHRFNTLELERRALAAELRALRDLADATRPVVHVGGDDTVELVLDLERLAAERPANHDAGRVPASGSASL